MMSLLIPQWSLKRWVRIHPNSSNILISNIAITDTSNALLRGELSAIETYTQVIGKFGPDAGKSNLEGIRADHVANAETLRKMIGESGDQPATRSGLWGSFAATVEGIATLLGESPSLMVLKQGEEHGIRKYEKALDDDEVSDTVKDLIRDKLLPAQEEHLAELARCKMDVA
jgi:hypothetical protein